MSRLESAPTASTGASPLKRGVIGVPGMVFMVIAAAAPLTAMASNLALSLASGAGVGTLGWIVLVGLLLAIFTSGYVALGRQVVSAGAYHAYVAHGLGPTAGAAIAYVALLAYNLAAFAMAVATGFFLDVALVATVGVDVPWWLLAAPALVAVGVLGHVGADVSTRVTAVISLLQLGLLVVFTTAVLLDGPDVSSLEGFRPSAVFSDGFAITLVFVLLSFACYEAAAAYGEECEAPQRKVRLATYISLGALVAVFLAATWALVAAYADVESAAQADPGALLDVAAQRLLGSPVGAVITSTVAVSFFAAAVSFHNLAVRYFFALGRSGLLPRALAHTGRRGTPDVAVGLQVALGAVLLVVVVVVGADPFTTVFPAVSGVTALGFIVLTCATSVSALVASLQGRLEGSVLGTRVAPAVAAVGLGAVGVLIATRYATVTGSDAVGVALVPLVFPAAAVAAWFAVRRQRDRVGPEEGEALPRA